MAGLKRKSRLVAGRDLPEIFLYVRVRAGSSSTHKRCERFILTFVPNPNARTRRIQERGGSLPERADSSRIFHREKLSPPSASSNFPLMLCCAPVNDLPAQPDPPNHNV